MLCNKLFLLVHPVYKKDQGSSINNVISRDKWRNWNIGTSEWSLTEDAENPNRIGNIQVNFNKTIQLSRTWNWLQSWWWYYLAYGRSQMMSHCRQCKRIAPISPIFSSALNSFCFFSSHDCSYTCFFRSIPIKNLSISVFFILPPWRGKSFPNEGRSLLSIDGNNLIFYRRIEGKYWGI